MQPSCRRPSPARTKHLTTAPAQPRTTFSTPRAAEFLDKHNLQSQTGQHTDRFGDVVVKELLDNALDAAEATTAHPEISLTVERADGTVRMTFTDNAPARARR